jgi:oxygen-independent coproporphyrinogen-3 oxidase
VRQYHWGGGTPTQLNLRQMQRVQDAFAGAFTLAQDAEVAIEVDPRVTTVEQVRWLASVGFNRVSMGVQDFEPAVQEAVKRHQTEQQTRTIVDAARAAGIPSVNIDLMYGLPAQTEQSFARTVEITLDIRPERVALFHYAHVPWMKRHQKTIETERAPSSEEKMRILTRSIEQFRAAGYEYIGLDHFALPDDELARAHREGWLGRNFMGYTVRRGDDMIGLGVSSIGDVSGCFAQNAHVEGEYLAAMREKGYATVRGHQLTAEDKLRRDVILGLMCNGALRKADVEQAHGIAFDATFATELAELRPLAADGLVELHADRLVVTELGQLFLRNVALPFDRYFRERKARGGDSGRTFSRTA